MEFSDLKKIDFINDSTLSINKIINKKKKDLNILDIINNTSFEIFIEIRQKDEEELERIRFKNLKSEWLDEEDLEIKRLVKKRIISPERIDELYEMIGYAEKEWLSILKESEAFLPKVKEIYTLPPWSETLKINKTKNTAIILGRVLEIKELYKKSHYVFTHGQPLAASVLNVCMQVIVKQFFTDDYHPLRIPLRFPNSVPYTKNTQEFWKKYKEHENDFEDNLCSDEIISVDAYPWNMELCESANYFASGEISMRFLKNLQNNEIVFKDIFKNIFRKISNEPMAEFLAKKACKIAQDVAKLSSVGNSYVICIPKDIVEKDENNITYRAHEYGIVCKCSCDRNEELKDLRRMQNGKATNCREWEVDEIKEVDEDTDEEQINSFPQYRILTSRLHEKELGVRVFKVNALSKEQNKSIKKLIKNLINDIQFLKNAETPNSPAP